VGALETLASVHSDIESDMKNIVQEIKLLHQRMDGIEKELQNWKSQRQQERIDQTR
jgi:prefoldin subunit 5